MQHQGKSAHTISSAWI